MSLISAETVKRISNIFCGDEGDYYKYKSGSQLVTFFNQYFGCNDTYGQGFPSRWVYVNDHIVQLINCNKFNTFLDVILSRNYVIKENECSEVEAAEKIEVILGELKRLVRMDDCIITQKGNDYYLVRVDEDLLPVGSGGFANVYLQKSTGLIVKRLKDDFLTDKGIRSRFKREFNITKSLSDIPGVIKVYSFDEGNCSYTMEKAERTLYDYVTQNNLSAEMKITCIRQILYVMGEVHNRDIIHRDLSPNNIFVINGHLKIADFGLGKDLNVLTSHQTMHTNAVGQYFYCAPEQFMLLRDGDKRSDVYSLGRIINFIMNENPIKDNHAFRNVTVKATNDNAAYRYADANQLRAFLEKAIAYNNEKDQEEIIRQKIANQQFDDSVESYIYSLSDRALSEKLMKGGKGMELAYIRFMQLDDEHASHLIQAIDSTFRDVCKKFDDNDAFARLSNTILKSKFDYAIKEIAANILRYVAYDVNRFSAQHMVEDLVNDGIEPMLEDILQR